jgi:hypothetical protein
LDDPADQASYEQVVSGVEATHPEINASIDSTPGQTDDDR